MAAKPKLKCGLHRPQHLGLMLAAASPPVAWLALQSIPLSVPPPTWPLLLLWCGLAPILEEWLFRGLLLTELSARLPHAWQANALTSLVFAVVHTPVAGVYAIAWMLPSLALGHLKLRGASLAQCMALHAWMNASLLGVAHAMPAGFGLK